MARPASKMAELGMQDLGSGKDGLRGELEMWWSRAAFGGKGRKKRLGVRTSS